VTRNWVEGANERGMEAGVNYIMYKPSRRELNGCAGEGIVKLGTWILEGRPEAISLAKASAGMNRPSAVRRTICDDSLWLFCQIMGGLDHPPAEYDWSECRVSKWLVLEVEGTSIIIGSLKFSLLLRRGSHRAAGDQASIRHSNVFVLLPRSANTVDTRCKPLELGTIGHKRGSADAARGY
jgi:hypothetical protein